MKIPSQGRKAGGGGRGLEPLLAAIVDADCETTRRLLAAEPGLAAERVATARLYERKILHWLYAGDTALHLVAAGHRAELVGCLMAAGADPNAAGVHRGGRPLHYAADGCLPSPTWDSGRQVATLRALLAAGAKVSVGDKNGATPLHRAVRTRSAAAVECLLAAGADPLLRNHPGSTPFHLAAQNTGRGGTGAEAAKAAQRRILLAFLGRGLKPDLKDARGKSVLDSARVAWVRDLLRQGGSAGADSRPG